MRMTYVCFVFFVFWFVFSRKEGFFPERFVRFGTVDGSTRMARIKRNFEIFIK